MKINLPESDQPRVVIVGGGFAGLTLARKLARENFQVVLLDKNNYHQFQPLFYQVAMAGLEPSSIVFPFRKLFQKQKNVFIRVTKVDRIDPAQKMLFTKLGMVNYDYLVLAIGADTNFFGNEMIAQHAIPMKSVSEALFLRNQILADYERALSITDYEERQGYIDIVIVGGGPTGVEVAGALAEMKKYILPKDYPELPIKEIDIHLVQGAPKLLMGMSEKASQKALDFLQQLDVNVKLNTRVTAYDGLYVDMADGTRMPCRKVIWAAGIKGNPLDGIPEACFTYGRRLQVNAFNQVEGMDSVYAIGDISYMETEAYPKGHPQVAQVAIQQGKLLSDNLQRLQKNQALKAFRYKDLGSMATIGRNRAVADLPTFKSQGAFAWFIWLLVHLYALVGVKNKLFVFLNWVWNYFTYDQSLRLIIKPKIKMQQPESDQAVS